MTLGQEFHGFATTLGEDHDRLKENAYLLYEINMGATAIGTGITDAPRATAGRVLRHLREITGLDLETATDLVEATSDTGVFMSFSVDAQAQRDQALEDLQRPAPALVRPAGRASARSTCRPARRGRASCPARSTR